MVEFPPPPPGLHSVRLTPNRISFRRHQEDEDERWIQAMLLCAYLVIGTLLTAFGIFLTGVFLANGSLWWVYGLFAGNMMAVYLLLGVAALRLSRRASWIQVHQGVLRVGLHRHDVVPSSTVQLIGAPGGAVELTIGNLLLRRFPDADDAWTYDAISWLGHTVAARLDRQLLDQRPLKDWRAWEADAGRRTRLRLKWVYERSRHHFPRYHACAPSDPADLEWTHEGVRFLVPTLGKPRRFMLSGTHIHVDGKSYPLNAFQDARVVFKQKTRHQNKVVIGTLQVGIGGDIVCLGVSEKVRRHGQLLWIAKEIRRAIRDQRTLDTGTTEDVPATLRAVRAQVLEQA